MTDKENKDAVVAEIKRKGVFNDEQQERINLSEDVIDACIESERYVSPHSLSSILRSEIIDGLKKVNTFIDKIEVAEFDSSNSIISYLLASTLFPEEKIQEFVCSNNEYVVKVGVALSVIKGRPDLMENCKNEYLYKFFKHRLIDKQYLHIFSRSDFIDYSLARVIGEESVVFVWMVSNLTLLTEEGYLDVKSNKGFFEEFIIKNDYLNDTHRILYLSAIKRFPEIIDILMKIKLSIDPFTKEVNYSQWLIEGKKFRFIDSLKEGLPDGYVSQEVYNFSNKKETFIKMNYGDRY